MFLYKNGGSLDSVNKEGFTPMAFGSQKLLSFLSLEKGISVISKPQKKDHLPLDKEEQLEGLFYGKLAADLKNNELMNSKIVGKSTASGKMLHIPKKMSSLELNNEY